MRVAVNSHALPVYKKNRIASLLCIFEAMILSITLLQNIANTLFNTIGEIKSPLLYCFRFETILNSWMLSQKYRQRERTSLRDSLRLPSNNALKMIRRQLLYVMKPEGSFYMCIKFQPKLPTQ